MPHGKSSDSLRAVLLSARSPSGSGLGSKPGSSALTWHSLRSTAPTTTLDPPGHYFPAKLALAMGLIKIFLSLLTMSLGAVAIVMKASISSVGAGLWVGMIIGVSGFLGVCAARRSYAHIYVISFMSVSILSLAASGILVVLSAAAWARDNQIPQIYLYDKETQSEVNLFGDLLIRRPSILVSGILVVLGVLDILTSLACVAISAREACGTGGGAMGVFATHDGHDKKERLYRWLGQQKTFFHTSSSSGAKRVNTVSQFVPLSSSSGESLSVRKQPSTLLSPTSELQRLQKSRPSENGKNTAPLSLNCTEVDREKRIPKISDVSKTSSGVSSEKKNSSVVFLHPKVDYELKEPFLVRKKTKALPPPSHQVNSLPAVLQPDRHFNQRRRETHYFTPVRHVQYPLVNIKQHPAIAYRNLNYAFHSLPYHDHRFYHPKPPYMYEPSAVRHSSLVEQTLPIRSRNTKENKQKRRKKKEKKHKKERKKNVPLTDKQIENSYTGLDREIAEGFISLAMEPAASQRKTSRSTNEPDETF